MIDRRTFLKILSGSATALAIGSSVRLPEKQVALVVRGIPSEQVRNGIEIIEGTQPMDADYLRITIIRWNNGILIGTNNIHFTCHQMHKSKEAFRKIINEEIGNAVAQLQRLTYFDPV